MDEEEQLNHLLHRSKAKMQASGSRLGACQSCHTSPAKYTCPGCGHRSCSVACSTGHKTAANCSGVAPPIWARPSPLTWGALCRDQSYIAGVGRAVEEVGRQLVQEKTLPQGRGAAGKGRIEEEQVRLDERSEKEERMVREARNDGVELVLLPKGMSKRLKNGTRWDQKNNRLEWTVEVAFQPRPSTDPSSSSSSAPILVTTVPQPVTASLYTVLSAALAAKDKKGKGKEVSPEDAAWVLAEKAWVESLKPVKEGKDEPKKEEKKLDVEAEQVEAPPAETPALDGEQTSEVKPEEAAVSAGSSADDPPSAVVPSADVQPAAAAEEAPHADPAPTTAPLTDEESPFVLLLAFFTRPSSSSFSDPSSASDPSSSRPSRPPARPLYLIPLPPSCPLPDLRSTLSGSTLLEHPTFEVWPRESFLRQKLLGKIKVVEKPTGEEVRREAEARAAYSGGRGRGRGRGRGGSSGGGRGGYAGSREGRDDGGGGGGGGGGFEGRAQDSGWGKRGPPQASSMNEQGAGGEKKPRLDVQ